jgi:hypothetical protein
MKTVARYVVYILVGTIASYVGFEPAWDRPATWLIFLTGPSAGLVCAIVETGKQKRKKLRPSEESENPYPPI